MPLALNLRPVPFVEKLTEVQKAISGKKPLMIVLRPVKLVAKLKEIL